MTAAFLQVLAFFASEGVIFAPESERRWHLVGARVELPGHRITLFPTSDGGTLTGRFGGLLNTVYVRAHMLKSADYPRFTPHMETVAQQLREATRGLP